MPFGKRPVEVGKDTVQVDFDALYEKAIEPALSALNYLCIRADHQEGSVIVKDMLEQLVHADLVIADVTAQNGNVYYEAGVRHAASKTGCVLICAEWSKLLFDIAQLRQLRYPFPTGAPTDVDYTKTRDFLARELPKLVDAIGPVYELTKIGQGAAQNSSVLKETFRGVFEFQVCLKSARTAASAGQKAALRALIVKDTVANLPSYALRELTVAVRECLGWGELLSLLELVPQSAFNDAFFYEQKGYALARQGRLHDAIGLTEVLIEKHGQTAARLCALGGLYRDLAAEEGNKPKRRQQESDAIKCFRSGMHLDLNGFACTRNLLVALVGRGRSEDLSEAKTCAILIQYATERFAESDGEVEELQETRAVLAFYAQDATAAHRQVTSVLDGESDGHSRVRLVESLRVLTKAIDPSLRPPFEAEIQNIMDTLPVPQSALLSEILPLIKDRAQRFIKFQQIHARPAKDGELVVSMTGDGEETTKVANAGEYVVK
ncbi:MAG: tetratricopeptide repeat-containing protein, partial [Polyangiaceae bacterium]